MICACATMSLPGGTTSIVAMSFFLLMDRLPLIVSLHIRNIYQEGELAKSSTVKESLTVQKEGKRTVKRKVEYYSF